MKLIIFYSWQSDLDPALTRNFIEDALKSAVSGLSRDEAIFVEAMVDRDTSGVAGTPGISESIFDKIDTCDFFVCDVSLVNHPEPSSSGGLSKRALSALVKVVLGHTSKYRQRNRPTPNPNVLVELGYAAARIGWSRIILVQNTAFGSLEALPFDLRHRRILHYNLPSKESRQRERVQLKGQFEAALKTELTRMAKPSSLVNERKPRWFGYWHNDPAPTKIGTLFIREVGSTGFIFHLTLIDGARTGAVSGFARFTGPDSAFAVIEGHGEDESCGLRFRRLRAENRQIQIEEGRGCRRYKGMGATFNGLYTGVSYLLFESGFLSELDLQRLHSITGQYFRKLNDRLQQIGSLENIDPFVASVAVGGVKGMYRSHSAVVMRGVDGQLWAAYVDTERVLYFSTELAFRQQPPKTIRQWMQSFPEMRIVVPDDVEGIPCF